MSEPRDEQMDVWCVDIYDDLGGTQISRVFPAETDTGQNITVVWNAHGIATIHLGDEDETV